MRTANPARTRYSITLTGSLVTTGRRYSRHEALQAAAAANTRLRNSHAGRWTVVETPAVRSAA